MFHADRYLHLIQSADLLEIQGRVQQVIGTIIEGTLPDSHVGQLCELVPDASGAVIRGEVVGFREDRVMIMPLGEMRGLKPGSLIRSVHQTPTIPVGENLLGRVLDGLGRPMDGGPLPVPETNYPIYNEPVNAFQRRRIHEPLDLGIRAINGLLTCGVGQRVGIMSGSGVGKSTLLGMIARQTNAEINVIALVGERGRELRDFIERDLGSEGLARSVVVTATSDRSPLERVRSAFVATAIAEYFRDKGCDVLLMMDSLTRFAMAQREIGLSIGEPPTTKGYPPSVFSLLPRLLERAGMGGPGMGSITGLYTVLVDGDDMTEPIADATRAILDGHMVLTRDLADQGHFPAIDVLASKSRLMSEVVDAEHMLAARQILSLLAAYAKVETLINIGAYVRGSNPTVDLAIRMHDAITQFLRQDVPESGTMAQSQARLYQLIQQVQNPMDAAHESAGREAASGSAKSPATGLQRLRQG
jgi:flagellum-specific ATP synthase